MGSLGSSLNVIDNPKATGNITTMQTLPATKVNKMNTRVYAYLRASTKEQDANRANDALMQFAEDKGLTVSVKFIENESGASPVSYTHLTLPTTPYV